MPAVRILGIVFVALAAGCAGGVKESPPGVMAHTGPLAVDPALLGPNPDQAAPPRATAPAIVSAAPLSVEQPRTREDPFPVAGTPDPPLDVAAFKARLHDTHAIGVFTKFALKNQWDDLLKQFRAHHQRGRKTGVASLRQPYDMLVLKVLAVVQDRDPSLARRIAGSHETIWGILADPDRFNAAA